MELVLVRHGQPAWADPAGRARNDPGLTPLGRRQAAVLAQRLTAPAAPPINGLVASTAVRARETAAPIAAASGLEPEVHTWLTEIQLPPEWEGTPEEDVGRTLADLRLRERDEWWDGAPGGESFHDFHARVTGGVDGFLADHGVGRHPVEPEHLWMVPEDAPRLVVVAHAGTNSVLLGHLLGVEPQPWEWERFATDHASVTVLRAVPIAGGHIWSLQYFSDVAHLDGLTVTA